MTEHWKYVKGYTGLYSVSTEGHVVSHRTGIIMKPAVNHKGYFTVQLSHAGHKKNKKVHRLVAEAFIDNPGNLREVDHINGNRQDNRVENLRWASGSSNTRNREACRQASSKYNGVVQDKKTGRYRASVWLDRKTVYLGTFTEETKAALAFNQFCKENCLNRELNLIEEV